MQIERSKNYLYRLNDEITSCKALLNSYHISCERKRQEAENVNNEISKLETLVNRFKSNNIRAQQSSSQPYHHNEDYNAMILDLADKLYSTLLKQLVSTIMDNTTAEFKNSSSQSKLP